ncbi:MAG: biotin synthase BioB [Desulfovibrionaceae bacterium]
MSFFPLLAADCSPQEALDVALHASEAELFASATALRQASFGKKVELCAIINARSGNCSMDCRFCSQSRHNSTAVATYPLLSAASLREALETLARSPVRHMGIVTSGAALDSAEWATILQVLGELSPEIRARVCGSLGRLPLEALQALRQAGMRRFHHNLESSEAFYPQVCTTQLWQHRLDTVHRARAAGLETCSGGLLGMGESWEDRIDFALRLRAEGIQHIPVNFLYPHAGTPLGGRKPLAAAEALRCIALWRHLLPTATLRVCGGRPLVLGERQHEIFAAGANALMTGDYLTTSGKSLAADVAMIATAGLELTC